MLVRLLVVLTLLGQPAPRACTCAAEGATPTPASAPSATAAPSSCACAGKHHQHTKSRDSRLKCAATASHGAPHQQHAPSCPACHPAPVDAVAQPVAVLDSADLVGNSFAFTPASHPTS